MRKYTAFAELEELLMIAIGLPGCSIKEIAATTGIKVNTLYKWKTTPVHLSPEKADKQLFYFMDHEPTRLDLENWYDHKNPGNPDTLILMQPGFPFTYTNIIIK